jgi:tRNA-specific 2-thiouridylase
MVVVNNMKDKSSKLKVFVGMSGGVDSSVSAALLKEQGYNVVGVFIKAWEPAGFDCGWREERREAMRVSAHLDIPFITLDLAKDYKELVVDYLVAEYKAGRTPNPDVMCNKAIKFGAFFKKAMADGADFIATGHYTRITNYELRITNEKLKVESRQLKALLAGTDTNKDQSYFLWTLNQNHLAHTLFPVGHLVKPEVRKLAEKFGLPNQAKKDSQGICFVGKLDLKDFLKEFIVEKPGAVLDLAGKVIGRHTGVLFYTLGERHGFEVFKKTPNEKPWYVVAKDLLANTITISDTPFTGTNDKDITIDSINWISGQTPDLAKKYQARIRYRQPLQSCHLEVQLPSDCQGQSLTMGDEKIKVVFDEPQPSISSGQSLVIYDGEICLGGGVIK